MGSPPNQTCPQCGHTMPLEPGYTPWCEVCNFGVLPKGHTLERNQGGLIADRDSSKALFDAITGQATFRKAFVSNRQWATLLSIGLLCIGPLAVLGLFWTFLHFSSLLSVAVLMVYTILIWAFFPRWPARSAPTLRREEAPELYALLDEVCAALHCPPLTLALDGSFNASLERRGWSPHHQINLGLPLFSILSWPEKVALLAHEVGHRVNRDSVRGLWVSQALASLHQAREFSRMALKYLSWTLIILPFVVALFWLTHGLLLVLSRLLYRDSQAAEYYADELSARVAGSAGCIGVLDKVGYADVYHKLVFDSVQTRARTPLFEALPVRVRNLPPRELERLRRVNLLEGSRVDSTHPPTVYRIERLKQLGLGLTLSSSPERIAALEQELRTFYPRVEREVLAEQRYHYELLVDAGMA